MNRPKLRLSRHAEPAPARLLSAEAQLAEQTVAAELERMRGEPFSAAAVAAELGCREGVAAELGSFLMPRGQRFHVRRVLTHISAYLRIDPVRLRELLGRGDADEPAGDHHGHGQPHRGVHEHGERRAPKVMVIHRRRIAKQFGANLSRAKSAVGEPLEV